MQKIRERLAGMTIMYTVQATPAGKYWNVYVPALDRSTQARNIKEIALIAKDLITVITEESPPQINVEYVVPEDVQEAIRLKAQAQHLKTQARAKQRQAAQILHDKGMTLRDIGALLGISYQRVHQLVAQA